ncbi:MAG: hypothetical protein JWM96_835 [Alphaproteobacteria bacterium]|nr:hypothetical protein [Alphaproteobacteria bacterium]
MSYIGGVLKRFIILVVLFLVLYFPGGVIIMGASCHGKSSIDGLDWIASIFVPFYGVIKAFIC